MNFKKALFLVTLFSVVFSSCAKKEDLNIRVLNTAAVAKIKGMDPVFGDDLYSALEIAKIYEGLLQYSYLERPMKLEPNLAAAMPEVSKDGLTYTFKIKQGVKFQDDKAFKEGIGRELVAADFVYSIKRLADPKVQARGWWLLDGKIQGLNEWRKKNLDTKVTDYNEEIKGLKALDKYTLQFKLTRVNPQFLYSLAMPFTYVVAHEVVDAYGDQFLNHPVGTGPFVIENGVYNQSNKIVYYKNPTFREKFYPTQAAKEFVDKGYLADAGKRLPLVDKLVVNVIEESQPRWLNFNRGRLDYIGIPKDNFDSAIAANGKLSPEFEKLGVKLDITPGVDVSYQGLNHDLDIFKNKLVRQALSLANDEAKTMKLFFNDQGILAQSIVPPGVGGYDPDFKNPYARHDIKKAKELLAKAGYPDGKGFPVITYDVVASTVGRQMAENFQADMATIGVQVKIVQNTWPELQNKLITRNLMVWGMAWSADYPDAENFLQLLYGPNKAPGSNGTNYQNDEFDRMFELSQKTLDVKKRNALYDKMNKFVAEEVPMIFGLHRLNFVVIHKWVKNYVTSDFALGNEQYFNVNLEEKKATLPLF